LLLIWLISQKAAGVLNLDPIGFKGLQTPFVLSQKGFLKPLIATSAGSRNRWEKYLKKSQRLSTLAAFRNQFTWLLAAFGNLS
jgi:hypothetical protein